MTILRNVRKERELGKLVDCCLTGEITPEELYMKVSDGEFEDTGIDWVSQTSDIAVKAALECIESFQDGVPSDALEQLSEHAGVLAGRNSEVYHFDFGDVRIEILYKSQE